MLAGFLMTPIRRSSPAASALRAAGSWRASSCRVNSGVFWSSVVNGLYMRDVYGMGLVPPSSASSSCRLRVTSACDAAAARRASSRRRPSPWWRVGACHRGGLLREPDPAGLALLRGGGSRVTDDATADEATPGAAANAAPVVSFEHVELAFDDRVVLRERELHAAQGHTAIILGASSSGEVDVVKIITGLLKADAGVVIVNGQRVDELNEQK